jgi:hypothetical protein
MPVILVTSKYHTRRTRLTWNFVSEGRSQPIVRAASGDPFDPDRWWQQRGFALSVAREYLGLMNYYAGFPVGAGPVGPAPEIRGQKSEVSGKDGGQRSEVRGRQEQRAKG